MKIFITSPSIKRAVSVLITIVLGIVVGIGLIYLLHVLSKSKLFDKEPSTNEIIAYIAIIVSIVTITINFVRDSLKFEYKAKYKIHISARVESEYVTLTCVFENQSKIRILPKHFYLFIDRAPETSKNGIFYFPNILQHTSLDEFNCELCKICIKDTVINEFPLGIIPSDYVTQYPDCKKTYHGFYQLKHLSPDSVTFIDPGESFSEDITLCLDDGVYRAILVAVGKNVDCVCTNTQFHVQTRKRQANNNTDNGSEV